MKNSNIPPVPGGDDHLHVVLSHPLNDRDGFLIEGPFVNEHYATVFADQMKRVTPRVIPIDTPPEGTEGVQPPFPDVDELQLRIDEGLVAVEAATSAVDNTDPYEEIMGHLVDARRALNGESTEDDDESDLLLEEEDED